MVMVTTLISTMVGNMDFFKTSLINAVARLQALAILHAVVIWGKEETCHNRGSTHQLTIISFFAFLLHQRCRL